MSEKETVVAQSEAEVIELFDEDAGKEKAEPEAERRKLRGWFFRMCSAYLRNYAKRTDRIKKRPGETEKALAEHIIRRACFKTAAAGTGSGLLTTGATLAASNGTPVGIAISIPTVALAIGGGMLYKTLVHMEMTCDLADVFQVKFNPDDPADFWRLFALAHGTHKHGDDEDPGKELVHEITEIEEHEVGEKIGSRVLGESVVHSIVPVIGVAFSTYMNYKQTKHIGETVRRYVRYMRAFHDAMDIGEAACRPYEDLLVEGMWYVFTADGRLNPEEATVLAGHMDKLDPVLRAAVEKRFTPDADETDWLNRLKVLPEEVRDMFLHMLEVAAAVDKSVSIPEQRILKHAAQALGRHFDMTHVQSLMKSFEEVGVLTESQHRHRRKK
jgi:hypothetical protein